MRRLCKAFNSHLTIRRTYDEKVIEYFENPPNVGSLDKTKKNVGTGTVGSVACGDLLKFQVEVGDDGKINNAVFKAFGCGSVIASSAYATELLKGMDVNDAYKIKNTGKLIRHLPALKTSAGQASLQFARRRGNQEGA